MRTPNGGGGLRRGATLLETMIALGILATAALGTLAGITAAGRDLREGQLTQGKMLLLDAKMERLLLQANKSGLPVSTAGYPALSEAALNYPPRMAFGAVGTWQLDIPPGVPHDNNDLSDGAYFTIRPNGEIVKLPAVAGPVNAGGIVYPAAPVTPCGTVASLPGLPNLYCREVANTRGPPTKPVVGSGTATELMFNNNPNAFTYWVRISRQGEAPLNTLGIPEAMYRREVIVP